MKLGANHRELQSHQLSPFDMFEPLLFLPTRYAHITLSHLNKLSFILHGFVRSVRQLLVPANVVRSSPILVTLMMEAIRSSETSVLTRGTWRNITEDAILHSHRCKNLKSYKPSRNSYVGNEEALKALGRDSRYLVKFEVFTAVTMKNGVFWDVTPCGSCKNRRFGGTWRLLHQGDKTR
jgi:hypothetical protein